MKKSNFHHNSRIPFALLLLAALPQAAHAGLYYWDTDGITAGFGTAGGTWGSSAFWSTDDSGAATTTAYTTTISDGINFGAGTIGLAAGTISVTGTQNAGALTFASGSGAIVLSNSGGAAINLAAASTITVNNANDTITSPLSGAATSLLKTGSGSVTLNGANTYTGTTIISAGTIQVGDSTNGSLNGTTGTALTFTGTSTLNVKEAASSTQGMGVLTFVGGEGNVLSTAAGANSTATLTFSSMAARPLGATANFNIVTNVTETQNKIVVTTPGSTVPLSTGSNNRGIFFNLNDGGITGNYARYDAAGYIRGTNYGVDTNSQTSLTSPAAPTSSTDLYLATGGEGGGITANTIRFTGGHVSLAAGTTLTTNGILLVGNATRNLGTVNVASTLRPTVDGGEVVIASQTTSSTSLLRIYPNIVDRGGLATNVTKAGIGQIVVGTTKDYTGVTTINSGIFRSLIWADAGTASGVGKGSGLTTPLAADIVINGGTLCYGNAGAGVAAQTNRLFTIGPAGARLDCSGSSSAGNWTIGRSGGNIAFSNSSAPASLTLANDTGNPTAGIGILGASLGDPGTGDSITSVTKTGLGTWQLAAANTYHGNTTILAGGTLTLTAAGSPLATAGSLTFYPTTNDVCNKVTGGGTANFNGTFNIDLTGANTTTGNAWKLVDVETLSENYGTTFAVTGFTNSSGVWTKIDGNKTWTFSQLTGVLSLVNSGTTTYTVIFNNNGGSGTMTAMTGSSAAALTSNTFTRTGYTFIGWNTAANGLGTAYTDVASYAFTANATMYAQWTVDSYTVTFDGNGGGTPSSTSKSVTYASTYGTLATVARTGYTFNGWFTASSGGTQLTSASTVAITGAQTLYAQWTINNYTVSFNMNGDSPAISSQSVQYNTTATQPSNPTQLGNTFAGWYSDPGLTTSFSFSTAITANTALYAKWTPVVTYQVTFDSNGGSSVAAQTVNDGSTATQPTAPTLANNTFAGWYTDNNTFINSFNFSTAITSDITLYAKWTPTPTIILAGTLGAVNTTYGTASATPTSFNVSGTGLTGNLTVTPPSGYEASLSSGSGYSTSLSITASGTLASTQVYVRLAATAGVASSPYLGNITVSGGGASSQTLATASSTVAKATATVVVTPYTVTYDGNPQTATVTSITGVNGESGATVGTVTLTNTTHTNAGIYASDSWNFTGTANYNNIGTTTSSIAVANGSFETTGQGLGGPWFAFGSPWSITNSPSNFQVINAVAGDAFSSTVAGGGTYIGLVNNDDCPITAPLTQNLGVSVTAGDTLTVTFQRGNPLISSGGAGVAYFDVAGTQYTMPFDTTGMTAGTWQLTTMTKTITNSGNLTLGFYGTTGNGMNVWVDLVSNVSRTSAGTPQTLTNTINKAGPSVTVTGSTSFTYSGSPQGPSTASVTGSTGTVTYSYVGTSGTTYSASATKPTNVGSYTVTATVAADSNYNTASSTATAFSIGKATPTATLAVSNSPVTYDGTPKAATVTLSANSVLGSVQNILTGGASTQTAAGTYAVTADFVPTDTANYNTLTAQSAGNFVIVSTYNAWAAGTFTNAFTDQDSTHDPDGDGLTNLQEYAFGSDPTSGSSGPGSIIYVAGGAVTTPGSPVASNLAVGEGVDYRAVFGRRKDYATAGLTYTVQFSVDLATWTDSTTSPTVLTGAGGANPSAVDALSVPYPFFIPYTRQGVPGYEKPTFFRVSVSTN